MRHLRPSFHKRHHLQTFNERAQHRDGIPNSVNFADLFGKKTPEGVNYEILGCTVSNTKSGCSWTFIPDKICQEKLSLGKVFDLLATKTEKLEKLSSLTKSVFPPGAFIITKFSLQTCGDKNGAVEFASKSIQPFDVIKDKLKVSKGELAFKFNYIELREAFSFKNIDIKLSGTVELAGQVLALNLNKDIKANHTIIKITADQLKATLFAKIFAKKPEEIGSPSDPTEDPSNAEAKIVQDGGLFSKLVIHKPVFFGKREEDGSYEIIMDGKATGISNVGDINVFVVVRKPTDKPTAVGIIASLKKLQPLKIISAMIGKDLENVEIIKDIELDFSIEYANDDIPMLTDPEVKKVLQASFQSKTASMSQGTLISLKIPVKKILKNIGTPANLQNIPNEIPIQILFKRGEKVSFIFPPDTFEDGMNVLAALAPKAVSLLNKYVFKSKFNIVIKKYDVNIKTNEVEIALSIPKETTIGTKHIKIQTGEMQIKHDNKGVFTFKLDAEMIISGGTAKIAVEKKGDKFELTGKITSLTSNQLIQAFGQPGIATDAAAKSPAFNFGVREMKINAEFGQGLPSKIRIIGNPLLFNWDGLKFEMFMLSKDTQIATRRHHQTVPDTSSDDVYTDDYQTSHLSEPDDNQDVFVQRGESDENTAGFRRHYNEEINDENENTENGSENSESENSESETDEEDNGSTERRKRQDPMGTDVFYNLSYNNAVAMQQNMPAPTFPPQNAAGGVPLPTSPAVTLYNKKPAAPPAPAAGGSSKPPKVGGAAGTAVSGPMDTDREMGMAVFMEDVRIDTIFQHLFNKSIMGTNWMVNLNIVLIMSDTDKNLFTLPEVKKAIGTPKKGIYFSGTLTIPEDCQKNDLCELAKKKMRKGAKLYVEAGYQTGGIFFLKAGYEGGHLELGKSVILNEAYFEAKVGLTNEVQLKGKLTVQIKPHPLVIEAAIKLQASGGIELSGKMTGLWKNPFNIPNFAFGNLVLTAGFQLPVFALKSLSLSGEVRLGMPGKELVVKGDGGLNMLKPTENYIFGEINKLTLGAAAIAFGYTLKLPQVILETGFPGGVMVGFSANPRGTEIKQFGRKLDFGFQMQGLINVLSYEISAKLIINPKKLLLAAELAPINIFNGAFIMSRKLNDEKLGPKVLINIEPTKANFFIQGALVVLGIKSEVTIDIDDKGLQFEVYGKLFGIVAANLTVKAPYGKNMALKNSTFQVSACISAELNEAADEANKVIDDAVTETKSAMSETENKVEKHSTWYNTIVEGIKSLQESVQKLQGKMSRTANKIENYEVAINEDCTDKCENGGGFWDRKLCEGECLVDKSVASIKIGAKVVKQELREAKYTVLMKLIEATQLLVKKAKFIIDSAEKITGSIKQVAQSGLDAARDVADYMKKNIIEIHHACFNTTLENASKACLGVRVNVTLLGKKNFAHNMNACFEMGFAKSIGKTVTDKIYPGISFVTEKIKSAKAKFSSVEAEEKEVNILKAKNEAEIKNLKKEVDEMPDDGDDDDNKKSHVPHHVRKAWTMQEMRVQMYSEFHHVTLTDDDAMEALNVHPDYSDEANFPVPAEIPLDTSALTRHQINKQENCELAKLLVRSFSNVSDHVSNLLEMLQNHKTLHKRESSRLTHKFNKLGKLALKKCAQVNCTEKQRNHLVEFAHKFTQAHLTRVKNLDEDFEGLGQRLLKRQSVAFAHKLKRSGDSVQGFLAKVKQATEHASRLTKRDEASKKYVMRLNAAFVALKELLENNDQSFKNEIQTFKAMRRNISYLRTNIPCAA